MRAFKHMMVIHSTKSAVPGIDRNDIHGKKMVVPVDVEEQRTIVRHLESEEATIQRLSDATSRAITTLREYRSALITNAVTGRIDLSDWKAEDEISGTVASIEEELELTKE